MFDFIFGKKEKNEKSRIRKEFDIAQEGARQILGKDPVERIIYQATDEYIKVKKNI